jgi:hypothetical protein
MKMKLSFAHNLHDRDGDLYENCLLLFCEPNLILKFENSGELEVFANRILEMLPEIRESENP